MRIKIDSIVPITPANAPKIKYNVPMSLWFVENNQREAHKYNELLIIFTKRRAKNKFTDSSENEKLKTHKKCF